MQRILILLGSRQLRTLAFPLGQPLAQLVRVQAPQFVEDAVPIPEVLGQDIGRYPNERAGIIARHGGQRLAAVFFPGAAEGNTNG